MTTAKRMDIHNNVLYHLDLISSCCLIKDITRVTTVRNQFKRGPNPDGRICIQLI